MNIKISHFIFLLATIICHSSSIFAFSLANKDKLGLSVYSIERVMRLDNDDIDIATACLLVSQQWDNTINIRWYRDKIDQMAIEIYENASPKHGLPNNIDIIKQLNVYLYDTLEFKSVNDANDYKDLLLNTVIDNRQGYCLSLSILYLALGERLGLPLSGVVVPGHFFVRYDDGRNSFNIEATSKGGVADDNHYIKKFRAPTVSSENMYMRKLTNLETIGCFFNNMANCYTVLKDEKNAEKFLKYSIELAPLLGEARNNLGNIYYIRNDFSKALTEFKYACRVNPFDPKAFVNIGNVYFAQQQILQAINQFNNAIDADSNCGDAYIGLARCYRQKQLPKTALSYLDKGLEVETGAKFWREYGFIYKDMKEFDIALEYLQRAINQESKWTDVYFEMAIIYSLLNDNEKAKQTYIRTLEIDPKLTPAMQNLANLYLADKDYKKALDMFSTGLDIEPFNAELNFGAGLCYAQLNDCQTALKYYYQAIKSDKTHKTAYFNLAVCFYNAGEFAKALENAQKAQELGFELPKGLLEELQNKIKVD